MESKYWLQYKITRRTTDGWFDATTMSVANKDKKFYEYARTQSGSCYIEALAAELSVQATDLWAATRGGVSSGTWAHPRVALDYARWLSLPFGVWLETWVIGELTAGESADAGEQRREPQPRLWGHQVQVLSETDLQAQIVAWLRRNQPDAVLLPGLGEFQDTEARRIDAYNKGYKGGQPDLLILYPHNRYTGMAIEFKTPRQAECPEPSDSQRVFLDRLQNMGFKTLVSNDLLEIYFELRMYFSDARVRCPHCEKSMSRRALARHLTSHADNAGDTNEGDLAEATDTVGGE